MEGTLQFHSAASVILNRLFNRFDRFMRFPQQKSLTFGENESIYLKVTGS